MVSSPASVKALARAAGVSLAPAGPTAPILGRPAKSKTRAKAVTVFAGLFPLCFPLSLGVSFPLHVSPWYLAGLPLHSQALLDQHRAGALLPEKPCVICVPRWYGGDLGVPDPIAGFIPHAPDVKRARRSAERVWTAQIRGGG